MDQQTDSIDELLVDLAVDFAFYAGGNFKHKALVEEQMMLMDETIADTEFLTDTERVHLEGLNIYTSLQGTILFIEKCDDEGPPLRAHQISRYFFNLEDNTMLKIADTFAKVMNKALGASTTQDWIEEGFVSDFISDSFARIGCANLAKIHKPVCY